MGWLDAILQRAPGLAAQGLAGKRVGQDRARQQQIEEEERRAKAEQRALEMSLLNERITDLRTPKPTPRTPTRLITTRGPDGKPVQRIVPDEPGDFAPEPEKPAPPVRGVPVRTARGTEIVDPTKIGQVLTPPPQRPTGGAGGAGAGGGRVLPASASSKLAAYKSILETAQIAEQSLGEAIKSGTNVSGPFTGRLTGITEPLNIGFAGGSDAAVSARAKLSRVTAEIRHQLSGAAISPAEFVYLQPFLSDKNDTEEKALVKLQEIIAYSQNRLKTEQETYRESGYRVGGGEAEGGGSVDDFATERADVARIKAQRAARKPPQ